LRRNIVNTGKPPVGDSHVRPVTLLIQFATNGPSRRITLRQLTSRVSRSDDVRFLASGSDFVAIAPGTLPSRARWRKRTKENAMTTKHFIATALASFVTLASVGPALATGDYYNGVDINAKNGASSAAKNTDGRATSGIRTNAATYGFPSTSKSVPKVIKGGEGEYYQGIIHR
jgi:hypothetical protein